MAPRAALLLIGDELLTGKVRDQNGHTLAKFLRTRGIALREIAVVADEAPTIGDALMRLGAQAELLFTSGGVGPTHDDRTLAAIAQATSRPLERHANMEEVLRAHYGTRINEQALRMADLPHGMTLCATEGWPVFRLNLAAQEPPHNPLGVTLYVLPGVPQLFAAKLMHLAQSNELVQAEGWTLTELVLDRDETQLADVLSRVDTLFPTVTIGSYPSWKRLPEGGIAYEVRITFECRTSDDPHAHQAQADVLEALDQPQNKPR